VSWSGGAGRDDEFLQTFNVEICAFGADYQTEAQHFRFKQAYYSVCSTHRKYKVWLVSY